MSDNTFDKTKNYKKVCYRADRDLLNTELNEAQDIDAHERRMILDKVLAQGTIISGLAGTVDGSNVTITDGIVYLDGCAVNVPGASLSFPTPGEHLIYVDVFRRVVTASDDPALVNPLTGEPTAEREKWIATLQTRDTTNDPLPDGALSRSVAPVYIFNRDTGELRPYVGSSIDDGDIFSAFTNHAGHGGLDRHPAVSPSDAGFMTPEHLSTLTSVEAALPGKADDAEVTAVSNALTTHKASSDHDSRYYTESEADGRFAAIGHVGSGGSAHSAATTGQAGFMSGADKTQLGNHETRISAVETALPGKADDADITAVTNSLNTHKSSADHDGRYYTETESDSRFAPISHVGSGAGAHLAATTSVAGFMSGADKTQLGNHETRIGSVEAALPGKADDADITAVTNSINTHKSSTDHDSRYYTESESNARYAAIGHVGATGNAHGIATELQPGFMPKEVFEFLKGLIHWSGVYDYGNDGSESLPYDVISGPSGMTWRGKCDANSTQRLTAILRSTESPITAVFAFYHMTGTVTMPTSSRVQLADTQSYTSIVPGDKAYLVQLYPDSFTNVEIDVTGTGDVCFSLNIFPGDERQICYEMDPNRGGKAISN